MKNILTLLIGGFFTLSVTAQTITLTFNGTNKNRNYQVVMDGTSYYSNSVTNPNNTNTSVKKEISITNQQLGSHTVAVYRLRTTGTYTNGTNTPTTGNAIYTNTFQLRQGYDMHISVNGNGQVTFREQRVRNRPNRGNQAMVNPMTDASFNQLLQSVRNQYGQSSKFTVARNAFVNTANYFTTDQVKQVLLLISSEANRLSLAKLAYPKVTDATNFTELYDVFKSVRSRDDMNAFIRANPNTVNRNRGNWNNENNNNNNNSNNATTRTPMADYQFTQLLQTVNNQWNQAGKVNAIGNAFNNTANFFSTSQLRQLLSLVTSESDRLELAKVAYARASDVSTFTSLYDLFNTQASRDELNNFVSGNSNNTSTYRTAMADYQFNQLVQNVNGQWNQAGKFNIVRDALNSSSNWFSTVQLRQLLSLVTSESDRLALAKLSYARVTDPTNFTSLYDLLNSQASRNDLNAYVIQQGGTGNNAQSNTRTAMADYQFNQLAQNVNGQWSQAGKFNVIRDALNTSTNWFSTVQIRQLLSVISSESDRLALAKLSYARVSDPTNFTSLYDLLASQASKNDLNAYIIQQGFTGTPVQTNVTGRTAVSDALFQQLYQKARNHFRPSSTLEDLREFFNTSSYFFSSTQIRQLLALVSNSIISSETEMLEVAKLSWHRVTDPSNFNQIFDLFTIQANRDALNAYIQARPY